MLGSLMLNAAEEPNPKRQRTQEAPTQNLIIFVTTDNQELTLGKDKLSFFPYLEKLINFNIKSGKYIEGQSFPVEVSSSVLKSLVKLTQNFISNRSKGISGKNLVDNLVTVTESLPNIGDYLLELITIADQWQVDPAILNAIRIAIAKNISSPEDIKHLKTLPAHIIFNDEFFKNITITEDTFLVSLDLLTEYMNKPGKERPSLEKINEIIAYFTEFLMQNFDTISKNKKITQFLDEDRRINILLKNYLKDRYGFKLPLKKSLTYQEPDNKQIQNLVLGQNGQTLVSADEKDIVVWNLKTGQAVKRFQNAVQLGFISIPSILVMTPDVTALALASDEEEFLQIFDLTTGATKYRIRTPHQNIATAVALPDNKHIISAGQGGLVIWDITTGRPVNTMYRTAQIEIYDIKLSDDGQYVAISMEDPTQSPSQIIIKLFKIHLAPTIQLEELPLQLPVRKARGETQILYNNYPKDNFLITLSDKSLITVFNFAQKQVASVAMSVPNLSESIITPNKKYLISLIASPSLQGHSLIIHEVRTGQQVQIINFDDIVHAFTLLPSGKSLLVAIGDRIERYDIQAPDSLIDILRIVKQ